MKRRLNLILLWGVLAIHLLGGYALGETVLRLGIYTGGRWDVPTGDSDRFFDELIAKFELAHPGARVEYESGVLKRDYADWLADRVLENSAPDVFLVLPTDLSYLSQLGVLEDLSPYMAGERGFDRGKFFSSALGEGRIGGRQYALAYEISPTLMLVNRTLLEKSGIDYPSSDWTMEDFLSICREVTRDTDGDNALDQFGVIDYTWREYAYSNGIRLFDEGGTQAYFNQPAMVEAVGLLKNLEALNRNQRINSNDFDSGKIAFRPFLFSSYRAYKPYPYKLKRFSDFEWECLPLPSGGGNCGSVLQSSLVGMSAHSPEKQLAWELIRMLMADEELQASLLDQSYGIPVLRDVLFRDGGGKLLPSDDSINLETLFKVVEHSVSEPCFREYDQAMRVADREIAAIISSEVDGHQALSELNIEINGML